MIVKCAKLFNENTKEYMPGPSDLGLTIGNLYSVLEIYYNKSEILYRIFEDGNYEFQFPILKRSDDFEIISGKLPNNWQLIKDGNTGILGPRSWCNLDLWHESFWQDWDNGLIEAKRCFSEELKVIFNTDEKYIKIIDQQQGRESFFKD